MKDVPYIFSVDLFAQSDDGALARKALAGEPVLIYPKGKHHRRNPFSGKTRVWTVDDATVAQMVDNYAHREERGLRQARLPVNEDHWGSRALGWYDQVMAMPEGVGATFNWNRKGREALEGGEFSYFSVEIYDEQVDRETGAVVKNQISGGALTNYPFFGEATSLMSRPAFRLQGGNPMTEVNEQVQEERRFWRDLFARIVPHSAPQGDTPPVVPPAGLPEDFAAQFEALQAQVGQFSTTLQTVTDERDAYAAQITTLETELAAVQDARATERYAVLAEGFAHLPAQTNTLAASLRWLHEADVDGTHRDFFMTLLREADRQFSVYFTEFGAERTPAGSAAAQLERAVDQYMADHPKTEYRDALDAVAAAQPELARAYTAEQEARSRGGA